MPGLFDHWQMGDLSLKNRIVVSPMCQYMADHNGFATAWHAVHYGSFALGGAGLIMVEATAVEARGRISVNDLGIYDDRHVEGLKPIVEFAHAQGVKIGVQLAHAGRKATVPEEIVAPSALAFSDRYQTPRALAAEELQGVAEAFANAAKRALLAGFDMVEIHAAHGYLLHEFLSPLSNVRTDAYGGSRENRLRFPSEVVRAVVAAVDGKIPVGIRVSASEYHGDGYPIDEVAAFCSAFEALGIAAIDVSSGGNAPVVPKVFPGYQVPLAERVKQATNVPVIAVGVLDNPFLAEHVIRSGKADAVAIGRGFLRDKHWGHTAARALGTQPQVPVPYQRAY